MSVFLETKKTGEIRHTVTMGTFTPHSAFQINAARTNLNPRMHHANKRVL
jgi:hypothetical protein